MPESGRGIFAGTNYYSPSHANVVDVINIDVQGNASDFGDLTVARGRGGCIVFN